jgi:hypothetical protein
VRRARGGRIAASLGHWLLLLLLLYIMFACNDACCARSVQADTQTDMRFPRGRAIMYSRTSGLPDGRFFLNLAFWLNTNLHNYKEDTRFII